MPGLAPDVTGPVVGPMMQRGLTAMGVPENSPADFWGQLLQRANQAVGGMAAGMGAIRGAASLTREGASVAGQSIAGQAAHTLLPDSPNAEIAASIIGGATTPPRRRSTDRQNNLDTLTNAGIKTPSAGMVTQHPGYEWTEAALSATPAGGYVLYKNAQNVNKQGGENVRARADKISTASSNEQAGNAIKSGIEKYVDDFRGGWQVLDNEVAKHFDPQDPVPVNFTIRKLDEMISSGKGADNTLSALSGSERDALIRLRDSLAKDAQGGSLPYKAFRDVRSAAGKNSASTSLLSELPQSAYKAIYGALSDDLMAAATSKDYLALHGGQDGGALKAIDNQNKYWAKGRKRIDEILDPLIRNKPEDIYTAAVAGSDKGATTLWALRRSLPEKDWRDFAAVFVDRMGRANKGQQNAEGDVWSAKKFLTDYNGLSPKSKKALFGSPATPGLERDLSIIADAAEEITSSGKQYINQSGTGQKLVNAGAAGATGSALLRGSWSEAAIIMTLIGGSYGTAKLMTYPPFVRAIASATKMKPDRMPTFSARLSQIAADAQDEEIKKSILEYQKAIQ